MQVFKYFIPVIIVIYILTSLLDIDIYRYSNQKINIEVDFGLGINRIYSLNKGSKFSDLLKNIDNDDIDISSYSLNEPLYDGEILNICPSSLNKISINNASIEDLIKLPGIGRVIANRIIDYREINHSFKYLEELKNVKGIGEKKYEEIKDQISL